MRAPGWVLSVEIVRGQTVSIVDSVERLIPVKPGQIGELWITGPSVLRLLEPAPKRAEEG